MLSNKIVATKDCYKYSYKLHLISCFKVFLNKEMWRVLFSFIVVNFPNLPRGLRDSARLRLLHRPYRAFAPGPNLDLLYFFPDFVDLRCCIVFVKKNNLRYSHIINIFLKEHEVRRFVSGSCCFHTRSEQNARLASWSRVEITIF